MPGFIILGFRSIRPNITLAELGIIVRYTGDFVIKEVRYIEVTLYPSSISGLSGC